uniref:Uncharacterized protein n=1 Tax=Arundo donax TaxID=35708 RepID=A0A0A8YPA8_ARUDO
MSTDRDSRKKNLFFHPSLEGRLPSDLKRRWLWE